MRPQSGRALRAGRARLWHADKFNYNGLKFIFMSEFLPNLARRRARRSRPMIITAQVRHVGRAVGASLPSDTLGEAGQF